MTTRVRDAQRGNAAIEEREDDVAERYLAHRLAEENALVVCLAPGRPEIAVGDFVAVGLILISDDGYGHHRRATLRAD